MQSNKADKSAKSDRRDGDNDKPCETELGYKAGGEEGNSESFRDREELKALLNLCRIFRLPDKSPEDLCRFITAESIRISKSELGLFGLVNEDETSMTTYSLSGNTMKDCEVENSHMERSLHSAGIWAEAIRERKAVIINDYKSDPRKRGYPMGHVPISRLMSIPIMEGDRVVSVVTVANSKEDYSEYMYFHLHLFCECFWGILKHKQGEVMLKKAYAEMENRAQECARESEALYSQFFKNSAAGTFRALYDPSAGDGRYVDFNDAFANILGYDSRDELTELPISATFHSHLDLISYINDILGRKRLTNYQSSLQRKNGKPVSVLLNAQLIDYAKDRMMVEGTMIDITDRVEAEKQAMASNELLRSLTSELVMTEERERRKIAIDLHDNIAQTLTLAKIKLDTLLDGASASDLRVIKPLLVISGLIDQSIQQTRSVITDISPQVLYELGLTEAIEWLCDRIQAQYNITITLKNDLRIKVIDEEIRLFLFRATRELLLNVIKHAKIKEAYVTLQESGMNILITVRDNGVGFDAGRRDPNALHRGRFGLLNIRERLKYLGGFIEIITGKGKGTLITLAAPQRSKKKKWVGQHPERHAFRP